MITERFDAGARQIARETRIALLRQIVERHQAREIEGRFVDAFSASAYLQIHDALKPVNQDNLNDRELSSAFSVVWTLVERCKS